MSDNLNDIVQTGLKVAGDPSMLDEYKQTMIAAGINPSEVPTAPDPGPAVTPVSLESLVNIDSKREGVSKESLPMRYLSHHVQDGGGKYKGYKSFMLVDVWHPTEGRLLFTTSFERSDGSITPLGEWVSKMIQKGDVFQVGEVPTNRGFTVYRPITVG
jgi:hypothetical protein